jgi:hypothetical protein
MQNSAVSTQTDGEEIEMSKTEGEGNGEVSELANEFERTRLSNVMNREKTFWKIGYFGFSISFDP